MLWEYMCLFLLVEELGKSKEVEINDLTWLLIVKVIKKVKCDLIVENRKNCRVVYIQVEKIKSFGNG